MSGNQELLASFQMLADAVVGLGVNNAIKKAQVKVDELNSNAELDQFEKIRQQQAIAKGVGASIIGLGGSASSAQNAMLSLAPDIPDTRMAQLEATGKGTIADATKQLQIDKIKSEKDMLKYQNDLAKEKQREHDEAQAKLFGVKTEAKGQQPLDRKSLEALDKPAQMASQWQDIGNRVMRFGTGKLVTPEMWGDKERTMFERLKAATESKARADLFGASLTEAEKESFEQIRGSLLKSGLSSDQYAAGFKQLADLQKQVYKRTLESYAVGRIGKSDQHLMHLAKNKSLFSPEELRSTALFLRDPKATNVEAELGIAPSAQNNQGYPVGGAAPAAPTSGGFAIQWDK